MRTQTFKMTVSAVGLGGEDGVSGKRYANISLEGEPGTGNYMSWSLPVTEAPRAGDVLEITIQLKEAV